MKNLGLALSYVIPLGTLWGMSLLTLHSVSPPSAVTQLMAAVIGAIVFFTVSSLDYQLYLFSPWPWYLLANVFLLLTFVLGEVTRGSLRWITVAGTSIQTSELVKPLLIVYIGSFLARHVPQNFKELLRYCLLMLVPTALIYLQPDLGSAILIVVITASSLISSGVNFRHLGIVTLVLVLSTPLIYLNLKPYQQQRLLSFVNPNVDPLGSGYNSMQATIAVGSGKIFGRGLGQGTQSHLRFLPERQTDFVFASLVEEMGLLGGFLVLAAYIWLAAALLRTAKQASTDIGSIICLTTLSLLLAQVVINMGMNMGIMPITGITLPFVSAGGSSFFSFALLLGICFSVARHPTRHHPLFEIR